MIAGPLLIAGGLLLLLFPGTHASYLLQYFPAICFLGFGMSIFVTPLTTTVMSSVPDDLGGVASGISTTMTRVAVLLATAALGLIAASRFDTQLKDQVAHLHVGAGARTALVRHADRLANVPVPPGLTPKQRHDVRTAINTAFVAGFRWCIGVCILLCLCSALVSALTIGSGGIRAIETSPMPGLKEAQA